VSQEAYDILDDPRYESTVAPSAVVVSRCPTVIPFGRKKMLRLLGLPPNATWEDANPIVRDRIVSARKANDDEAATKWGQIRDELEKKLARHCECGVVIASGVIRCMQCSATYLSKVRKKTSLSSVPETFWAHLGTMSDRQIERIYNVPHTTVYHHRKRLGIPRFDCFAGTPFVNPKRNWAPEIIAKLGTMSDQRIADMYGLCRESVTLERNQRQILAFAHSATEERRALIPDGAIQLIGKISDRIIAKRFGLTRDIVRAERNRRNIPPYKVFRRRLSPA
jgi:hypothetical protein